MFQKKRNSKKMFLVDMFSTKIRGGKAFDAERKIHKLKKRISKLKEIKNKSKPITPIMLIKKLTDNVNQTESEKYGYNPNYIEQKSLLNEKFRIYLILNELKNQSKLQKDSINTIKNYIGVKERN